MVLVAIAGGTSVTLGRSIVQALSTSSKHEVVILSRSPDSSKFTDDSGTSKWGAPIRYVDYTDVETLNVALSGVHTLISVVASSDPAHTRDTHKNMLIACSQNGVQRFIMSDWGLGPAAHTLINVLTSKAELGQLCEQENNRRPGDSGQGDLQGRLNPQNTVECCTIHLGCFMNYFVQGYNKEGRDANLDGGLVHNVLSDYIDITKQRLTIPVREAGEAGDDGAGAKLSLTDINDVGPLVVAALDLPAGKLKGQLGCIGETASFGDIKKVLIEQCGVNIENQKISKVKCVRIDQQFGKALQDKMRTTGVFDVELLKSQMVAQIYALLCDNVVNGSVVPPTLNEMLSEAGLEVPTTKIEDLLIKAWS